MSGTVARLRSLLSPGVLPHLLFGFTAASLLFSVLHNLRPGLSASAMLAPRSIPCLANSTLLGRM